MLKKWLTIIIVFCVIGGFYYVVVQTTFFHIEKVVVQGDNGGIQSDDFKGLLGLNLILVRSTEIHKHVVSNPYVLSYTVKKKFPDTIQLNIVGRKEFAAIRFHDLYIIIDADGIVLDIRKEPADLLMLDGFSFESVHLGEPLNSKNKETLTHSIQLMLLFKQNVTFPYTFKYQGGIEVQLTEQLKVKFGEGDEVQKQFVAFMTIYKDIVTKGVVSGVIDVSKKDYYIFKPVDQ